MFHNIKLQTKIVISFSVLVIAVITIFGLYMSNYIFKTIQDRITENISQLSIKISQQLDSYFTEIDQVSIKLIVNNYLLTFLNDINRLGYPVPSLALTHIRELDKISMETLTFTSIPTSRIYIYSKDQVLHYSYNASQNNFGFIKDDPDYLKMLYDRKLIVYANNNNSPHAAGSGSFSLIRSIFDINENFYGFLEVQEDYGRLDNICNIGVAGRVFILDRRNQFLFPAAAVAAPERRFITRAKLRGNQGILKNRAGDLYSYNKSAYTGLTVIIKYSNKAVFAPLYWIKNTTFAIIGIVTLLSLFMTYLISKLLVHPLRKLRDSIVKVSYNNMALDFKEKAEHDEVNLLNDAFQNMLDRLKNSMDRELAAGKEEARARFAALQAQISPHFIHNMLYVISINAQENKTRAVMDMCKQLSNMLRYIVDSPFTTVTLEAEIAYTMNYLSLQEKNYEDFLECRITVPEAANKIPLPRLVIQPFVENAFQHGFKKTKPPWRIGICCTVDQDSWMLSISDNGCGIDPAKSEAICAKLAKLKYDGFPETRHTGAGMCGMGIVNTVMRLKLMYHDALQFEIIRNEDGGTTIGIKGPLDLKDNNENERGRLG